MTKKLCWFNQRWNAYLYSEGGYDRWKEIEKKTIDANGGTYRLTSFDVEGLTVFTFGWLSDDLKQRPGHGGEWSSNAQNINEKFSVNITEIGMDQLACAIDITVLKELLGETFTIFPSTYGMNILSADGNVGQNKEWRTVV